MVLERFTLGSRTWPKKGDWLTAQAGHEITSQASGPGACPLFRALNPSVNRPRPLVATRCLFRLGHFLLLTTLSIAMRGSLSLWVVLGALCVAGCGHGDTIWVSGVLQKGGEVYKPPDGRKLAIYFCPMKDGSSGQPIGEVEMADYNSNDGSFTVPGARGYGIPPGKYRIALVETPRREALDQLKKASKPKRGQQRITNDTNFLEDSFGEKTSPLIHDLRASTKLTLDMAKPTG